MGGFSMRRHSNRAVGRLLIQQKRRVAQKDTWFHGRQRYSHFHFRRMDTRPVSPYALIEAIRDIWNASYSVPPYHKSLFAGSLVYMGTEEQRLVIDELWYEEIQPLE